MRSAGKRNNNQEEEEYEDDDFSSRKEGPSSTSNTNNTNNSTKEGKSNDQKANAIRSKHSVTEQRRRSKINERFQILRDLIPHSDQKRDTASFLLEVIEYVQYLQEKVQKYEGSYQGWSPEPTKLMPWRNSHWRVQNFVGHPQPLKNGSGPGSTFSGKFDESNTSITPTMLTNVQDPVESDLGVDATCRPIDQLPELANKVIAMPTPLQAKSSAPAQNDSRLVHSLQTPASDAQSTDCPTTGDTINQQEDLMIEGGTISISSVYSQGLLNTLTQALQNAGVDLSQANVSVQIDLGKRANRQQTSGTFLGKDHEKPPSSNQTMTQPREASSGEDSDHAQKRLKT